MASLQQPLLGRTGAARIALYELVAVPDLGVSLLQSWVMDRDPNIPPFCQ